MARTATRFPSFNEAAADRPRKYGGRYAYYHDLRASMRPRPIGRGNPLSSHWGTSNPLSFNEAAADRPRK